MNNGHSPAKTADMAILGDGVTGASIAFHLAQRKPGSINRPGQGYLEPWRDCLGAPVFLAWDTRFLGQSG